eukprot:1160244-Pelagomonas_calceolata.AAC.4
MPLSRHNAGMKGMLMAAVPNFANPTGTQSLHKCANAAISSTLRATWCQALSLPPCTLRWGKAPVTGNRGGSVIVYSVSLASKNGW